jgi:hypothetical protein
MTTAPARFNYSDDRWRAVAAAIPQSGIDIDSTRKEIEAMVLDYLVMSHQQRKRSADGSMAKETRRARDNIKAALAFAEKTQNDLLRASLEQSLRLIEKTTNVEAFDMLADVHRGRKDPALDLLYHRLLQFWTAVPLNGKLTIGRSGGAKTSAVIRFLVAALAPVHPISPETAAKVVKQERDQRTKIAQKRTVLSKKI